MAETEQVQDQGTMSHEQQQLQFALSGVNDTPGEAYNELQNALQRTAEPEAPVVETSVEPSLLNNELNSNPNDNPPAQQQEPTEVLSDAQTQDLGNQAPEESAPAEPTGESIVDSPLFKMPEAPTEGGSDLSSIEGIEGVNSFIAEKHPEIKDFNSLMDSYESITSQNAELLEVKTANDNLLNGLNNLHPDLIEAIRLNEAGEDFRSYISSRPDVTYDSKVEDIDKKALIKAYYPDKVSEEDFEAAEEDSDDFDPNVSRFVDTVYENAVAKFKEAKANHVDKVDRYLSEKTAQEELYKTSVQNSLGSVKEFFPDATPTYVQSIEGKLLNNGINSLFYDEKGQLKPDAAARFVRASDDGANLVSQLQKIAYNQAKTDANLDTLTRGQRTAPDQGGREMRQSELSDKAKHFIENVIGGVNEPSRY
jgi:hypothetical protein